MVPGESVTDRFQRWYRMQPEALRKLLTVNVVIYLVWSLLLRHFSIVQEFVLAHLALRPQLPGLLFEPWQLVTYNFLHLGGGFGGLLHILFNMLWLYWIGRDYEQMHGSHKLTACYVLAGTAGGLLTLVVYSIVPQAAFVYGASASVIGVLAAVTTHYPDRGIGLLFIGVVPLKYLLIGFLALDLLLGVGSDVAVSAHFGGALGGFLFARAEQVGVNVWGWARLLVGGDRSGRGWWRELGGLFSSSQSASSGGRRADGRTRSRRTRDTVSDSGIDEREVDRILDKISEKGYDALTEEERRILHEASQR